MWILVKVMVLEKLGRDFFKRMDFKSIGMFFYIYILEFFGVFVVIFKFVVGYLFSFYAF